MKVYIRNKLITLRGSSDVFNENKEPVYRVKGKLISPTRKKYVKDQNGNVLYIVRNKFWFNWFVHTAFIYDAQKNLVCKVKDKCFNINNDYYVVGTTDEIQVSGKFFSPRCQILKNGEVIGTINREITIWKDAFELEADEKDIPFLISLVIAIDNIQDKVFKKR